MKTRNIFRSIPLLFALVLLTNCGNIFDNTPTASDPDQGLVTIQIADRNAGQRTLLPSAAFSRYTFTFTREGKEPVALSSASGSVNAELEGGVWDLTVNAYVVIQGTEYLAARGSKAIAVTAGTATNETVSIAANNTGEEGIFSYDIRLALDIESLTTALLSLESLDTETEYKKEIDLKTNGAEKGTFNLKPGFYLLRVLLENEYQAAGKTEVVHIYTNMETKAEYTFRADDFTRLIPLKGTARVITHSAAQEKVTLFVLSEEDDLIASTEVDLSTSEWEAMIPSDNYEKVYFKLRVEDAAGFSFIKAAGDADIPEIGKTGIALNIAIPEPHISAFSISAAETGLPGDLTGVIDQTQSTITLASQAWVENIAGLKAAFEASGTVTVNSAEQESGVTAQDFRSDIVYTVTTEDNAAKDYTVAFESPQATGLPVIKIDTQGIDIVSKDDWFTDLNPGVGPSYTIYDENGAPVSGSTDIKGRGNSTWGMPKKPYSLKLASKAPLLGMPTHKRWNLLANYSDKTLLRTEAAFKLGEILQDGLKWTPRSRQVQLYVNNQYQGVYQLVEAIKIDENRVDIKDISKKNPQRGYILEIDARKGDPFNFTTTRGVIFNCSDPDEDLDETITGDTRTLFEKIQEDVQHTEDVLYSDDFSDPDEGYQKYLDVDSFIDWYLVNEITKNNDAAFWSSVYMYYNGEKYCMGPVWDFDISLGNYKGSPGESSEGFYIKDAKWITRLFEDPAFVLRVKGRWNNKKAGFFALQQYIDERAAYLDDAQKQNFRRWDILGVSVWPNVVVPGSYQGEIDYLKSWLAARLSWLDTAINGL
ncbi:MAG: CotH kinase family protein [Treponema sp.]|nr:CotH kinase family protein [Treponema sp.]